MCKKNIPDIFFVLSPNKRLQEIIGSENIAGNKKNKGNIVKKMQIKYSRMFFFGFNVYLCYELGLDFIVKFYFLY